MKECVLMSTTLGDYKFARFRPSYRPSVTPSFPGDLSHICILFEVEIPNLVCGCILGWQNVATFSGHCDPDLDL